MHCLLPHDLFLLGEQEQEQSGEASRMRTLSGKDLLIQLPYLQRLLQRLVDCRPGGPCVHDQVVQVSICRFYV